MTTTPASTGTVAVRPSRQEHVADQAVFIVGAQRSGTTWLQRLVLEDARIAGGQESHFFAKFGKILRTFDSGLSEGDSRRRQGLNCYWERDAFVGELRGLWRRTAEKVIAKKPNARLLLEKTPDHAMWLPEIREVVPGAKVIHLIRDSRAVVASLLAARRDGWASHWAPATAQLAAETWNKYVGAAARGRDVFGSEGYIEVFYEELLCRPVEQLKRIYAFLGLEVGHDDLIAAVQANDIGRLAQKREVGAISVVGDAGAREVKEPQGFFRKGQADSWRTELTFWQKMVVWRKTRRHMIALGYTRHGRPRERIGE